MAATTLPLASSTTQTSNPLQLSEPEIHKLIEFKAQLLERGLWKDIDGGVEASHDDSTLLRFLRANRDVPAAAAHFSKTEQWLKENKVQELYENIDVEFFERARRLYGLWTGRRDRQGQPLYVYQISQLDTAVLAQYIKDVEALKASFDSHKDVPTSGKQLVLYAVMHNILSFVFPLCSSLPRPNPSVPITMSTSIIDISGVGLRQWWVLKDHIAAASELTTAHYPEILDKTFVVGAPAFFPVVWGWVKRWFNRGMVERILILREGEVKEILEEFVDLENVPEKYGGRLKWVYGDVSMDEEMRRVVEGDGRKGWVEGPCVWKGERRVLVGSVGGMRREVENKA